MSVPPSDSHGPGPGSDEELFADFLASWHDGARRPIEDLCGAHPQHADTFRRWWQRLVAAGEVQVEMAMPEPERRFGPYAIVREIGAGAQGTVYLAEDTRLHRRVALKVLPLHRQLSSSAHARFEREADIASRLDHPNICTIFETGRVDDAAFIAMRWIDGDSLASLITSRSLPDVPALLALFEKVALALHAAHELGLVHRDIKPGNIMLTKHGEPVVLDFGLAREENDLTPVTLTGDLVGTPAYMSPEQIAGGRIPLDRRTDVYSLGATLFECVAGARPFAAPTRDALYQQILTLEAPGARSRNTRLSKELEVVLATALEKASDRRYQTAADFAEDVRRVRTFEPILAKPVGLFGRLVRWRQREPRLAASLLVLFATLAVGLATSLWLYRDAESSRVAYERLADLAQLEEAKRRELSLYPAGPEMVEPLEAWLREYASPLRGRLRLHRQTLERLRRRALPLREGLLEQDQREHVDAPELARLRRDRDVIETIANAGSGALTWLADRQVARLSHRIELLDRKTRVRRTWEFSDSQDRFHHDSIAKIVGELEAFCREDGILEAAEKRLAWSQTVAGRTLDAFEDRWQKAVDYVASSATYGKRQLSPQVGLVPLGPDPGSELLEFAYLRSGDVPERDPKTGKLAMRDSSAIVFVLLPGGRPWIGAQSWDKSGRHHDRQANVREGPPRQVELDWFLMAKCELSQEQWATLSGGERPSLSNGELHESITPRCPVESVSWEACDALLRRHGLLLPTEAQWEYAARSGTTTPWPHGRRATAVAQSYNLKDQSYLARGQRVLPYDDGFPFAAPTDSFEPNRFGLHHVCGNVAEWCRDHWSLAFFAVLEHLPGDGLQRMATTRQRAIRGGSFSSFPKECRVSARQGRATTHFSPDIGCRPVRRVQ